VSADFTESQILGISVGSTLLCSKRITYIAQGVFEYNITKIMADKYEYCVYIHGRDNLT
jgi:GntR family transcriptional regulator